MRWGIAACAVLGVVSFASVARADIELQNDGFVSGQPAVFQQGFASGEAGAVRLVAPAAGRQLLKVHFLFGTGTNMSTMRTVTVKVYDDSAGTDNPGTELFTNDYTITASDIAMQEVDLIGDNVVVPQQFRVSLQFTAAGSPSIARDNDGTIAADKNYILANGVSWKKSSALGLTGDWVIRAVINGTGPMGDAGVGGDAAVGMACSGNAQCPMGQFCDTAQHACTFECRTSADCNGGTCNSLGMCIGNGNNGNGGGCCEAGGGTAAAPLLGAGVLAAILRRRRRSRL